MTLTSLVAAVAPHTGKIIKNLLQNGILHFVFRFSQVYYTLCLGSVNHQKSRWKVRIYTDEKPTFLGLRTTFL